MDFFFKFIKIFSRTAITVWVGVIAKFEKAVSPKPKVSDHISTKLSLKSVKKHKNTIGEMILYTYVI